MAETPIQCCGDGLIFHNGEIVAAIGNRSMGCDRVQLFQTEKTIMDPIYLESTLPKQAKRTQQSW